MQTGLASVKQTVWEKNLNYHNWVNKQIGEQKCRLGGNSDLINFISKSKIELDQKAQQNKTKTKRKQQQQKPYKAIVKYL